MAKIMAGKGLQGAAQQSSVKREAPKADDVVFGEPALFSRSANDFDKERESEGKSLARESSECVTNTLSSMEQKCLVVHEIAARYGNIEHLIIREDGAVFLLETRLHRGFITHDQGLLLVDGRPFEEDFIRQTTTNAFVLRDLLADGLGISPFIHAAIVFPNASVGVERAIYGVDVIEGDQLRPWMSKARGNQEIAGLVAATWRPLN